MLRPVIFIGCGGSGEKAVRYVRDAVKRRLDQSDWRHGIPDSWQFIGLDSLTVQENPTEIPTIPGQDFLTLSAEHETYVALHRSLEAEHSGVRGTPELLCGWLPDPANVRIPIKDGAGQTRAIGRALGLRMLERTLEPRLKEAFRRAKSGNQDLFEVGQALGVDAALGSETPEPLVVVCSSMAGGTGAGVALDVVDLLRRSDPLGRFPTLVLFANDIFDFQDKNQAMAANSLGVLSELLAAYWSQPGEVMSPLSTNNVQDPGVGPHSVFILGKSGLEGADLGSTAEFYHAVGEALSSWVTSSNVQEEIHNFINVNWFNNAKDNFGGYPFAGDSQSGVLSSFGAAKVTVGRERFAQWARHQLGYQIIDRLLNGHQRDSIATSDSSLRDEEVIAQLGNKHAGMIYEGHPLWEAPPEQSPGLRGAVEHYGSIEQVREMARRVEREIRGDLGSGIEASGEQWHSQLERVGKRHLENIERETQNPTAEDRDWCQDMIDATCKSASQVAAVASLPVAVAALEEVATRLNRSELVGIQKQAENAEKQYLDLVRKGLKNIREAEGKISADSPRLTEAVRDVARGLASRWRSLRLKQAAEVMGHAEEQVFGEVARALKSAVGQIGEALDSDELQAWPRDITSVPPRYQPSTVEFPLESHKVWNENLRDLCLEAVIDGVPCGAEHTDPLRYQLVAGTKLSASEKEIYPLVHRSSTRWTPGQVANVNCDARTDDIIARVDQWTSEHGGKFKRFIDEGLGEYLKENDPHTGRRRVDQSERLQEFRRQLGEAKTRSKPLVSIDRDLYGQCHDENLSLLTVCSQFPFPDGHPAKQQARDIVGEKAFTASNTDTTSVLISQYIASPVHPMVVRSITGPVTEALNTTEDPDERSSAFWLWRRARRLDAFVPLPRPALESMVRGFAVARLCGYVTADPSKVLRITAAPNEVEFPWPLLSRPKDRSDVLAVLLEGFSLTFGMVSGAGFRAFEAYRRLHALGEPTEQRSVHDDLQEVLNSGRPPHPTVAGEKPKAEGADYPERLSAARSYLEANEAMFVEQGRIRRELEFHHRGDNGRSEPGVPTMELADVFCKCYSELHTSLDTDASRGSVV